MFASITFAITTKGKGVNTVESYTKYDYLDIQQSFFVWYRSDKGYFWDEEAKPGGIFSISPDGTIAMPTSDEERQLKDERRQIYGPHPPFLLAVPETTGFYPLRVLEEEPTLFLKFADVIPTRKGILEFANKYGMLTHGETQVFSEAYRLSEEQKPPEWSLGTDGLMKENEKKYAIVFGESLQFWQHEIRDMAWTVWVWEALKEKDIDFLKRVIYWDGDKAVGCVLVNIPKEALRQFEDAKEVQEAAHPDNADYLRGYLPEPKEVPLSVSFGWLATEYTNQEILYRFKPGDLFLPAKYLVQSRINKKLEKYITKPRLLLDEKNQLRPYLMPESLLAAMWYQFYLAAVGEKRFKRCSICGRWEDVTEKTSAWTKHEACANKERVRKYRQAVREAQKLYREGKPLEYIATELGRSVEWVKKQVGGSKATSNGKGRS